MTSLLLAGIVVFLGLRWFAAQVWCPDCGTRRERQRGSMFCYRCGYRIP